MKSIFSVTLIMAANAVEIERFGARNPYGPFSPNPNNILTLRSAFPDLDYERATSQDDCDDDEWFSRRACACLSRIKCRIRCPRGLFKNPFECGCITRDEQREIRFHGLGNDCSPDDSPTSLSEPRTLPPFEVTRVSGPDMCRFGQEFNQEACACFSKR